MIKASCQAFWQAMHLWHDFQRSTRRRLDTEAPRFKAQCKCQQLISHRTRLTHVCFLQIVLLFMRLWVTLINYLIPASNWIRVVFWGLLSPYLSVSCSVDACASWPDVLFWVLALLSNAVHMVSRNLLLVVSSLVLVMVSTRVQFVSFCFPELHTLQIDWQCLFLAVWHSELSKAASRGKGVRQSIKHQTLRMILNRDIACHWTGNQHLRCYALLLGR